jgi:CubicO group peptidase (beta-lactamase class C family)
MPVHARIQHASVLCFCALLIGLTFPLTSLAADPEPLSPDTQKALEAAVAKELKAYGGKDPIPGAVVGVWIPGKAPFLKGIGLSDIAPAKPIAIDDKFRVGSNTKTFVVTVLLQLVDEKKLSLEDTISKFDLGVTVPNADKITVTQLCQMESGLPDVYNVPEMDKIDITVNSKFTAKQLVDIAGKQPPLFAPGVTPSRTKSRTACSSLWNSRTPVTPSPTPPCLRLSATVMFLTRVATGKTTPCHCLHH